MKLNEFLKQPVAVYAENNVQNHTLTSESSFKDILTIAAQYRGNFSNFLEVYVDSDFKPRAAIKAENLDDLIKLLESVDEENYPETLLGDKNIEQTFPLVDGHVLKKSDKIQKAIKIFTSNDCNTNTLLVVDDGGRYIGKVRRSKLIQELEGTTSQ